MKRHLFKIFISLFILSFFWKPLFEGGVSFCLRNYLKLTSDLLLDYRKFEFQDGFTLVFTDFILESPDQFEMRGEKGYIDLKSKHLEVQEASIELFDLKPSNKSPLSSWTYTVQNAKVKGEGISPFHLRAEKIFPGEVGSFFLSWEKAKVRIEAVLNGSIFALHANLAHFNPELLPRWFKNELSGDFTGKIYVNLKDQKADWGTIHLEGKDVKWQEVVKEGSLAFDFEGPFGALEESRFRLQVDKAKVLSKQSSLENIGGELSFVGGMGAKWEFKGLGLFKEELFPVSFEGRGYFQKQKEHWVDASLVCKDATFLMKGEKDAKWLWSFSGEKASFIELGLIQSFGTFFYPETLDFEMAQGKIDFQSKIEGSLEQIENWELSFFQFQDFKGSYKDTSLHFDKLTGFYSTFNGKGKVDLFNGDLDWKEKGIPLTSWSGETIIENQKCFSSKWKGNIEGFSLDVDLKGDLQNFQMLSKLDGMQKGSFQVEGSWNGSKLNWALSQGVLDDLEFSVEGWLDTQWNFFLSSDYFKGPLDPVWKLLQLETPLKGTFENSLEGLTAFGNQGFVEWSLKASLNEASYPLFSHGSLEHLQMELVLDNQGIACYNVKGDLVSEKTFSFFAPVIQKEGVFDLRFLGETWDFARFAGNSSEEGIELDLEKSHFLGAPFEFGKAFFDQGKLAASQIEIFLPFQITALLSDSMPFIKNLRDLPISGDVSMDFHFERSSGFEIEMKNRSLSYENEPLEFCLYINEEEDRWNLEHLQVKDVSLSGELVFEQGAFHIHKGKGKKEKGAEFDFEARTDFLKKMEVNLSHIWVDLSEVPSLVKKLPLPVEKLEGIFEGTGHLLFSDKLESDFDFTASSLKADNVSMKNEGPVHVYFSSEEGISFKGLNLALQKETEELPPIKCKIDLLRFDPSRSFWVLKNSHIHLPSTFLKSFHEDPYFFNFLDTPHDIDLLTDIECSSDFSFFNCSMKEGFLPFLGELRHVEKVRFVFDKDCFTTDFSYYHQHHLLKMGLNVNFDSKLTGRIAFMDEKYPLTAEEIPLFVDWSYGSEEGLSVQAIEGSFAGIEAHFHRESEKTLIGSARLDFKKISEIIPPRIAQVFCDLKMGKGYELKGRLHIDKQGPDFKGLLSGKQIEFFDYQLRTLLGQIELNKSLVHIFDLKMSDSAGMMKIEKILCEEVGDRPWTLSIPKLVITELRPSLLLKVGKDDPGEMTPLVVRELKIENLKGILEDSKTYTAQGDLFFINSYRREHTVFDYAPDMLSRIAGLDMEILIPVCGTLNYELKDGFFFLKNLKDSFSQGKRTEFFLMNEDFKPTVDLDGNLKILIKMKQFVLFKFTESFLISVEGKLNDPKFHLEKRNRFLGL